MIHWVGSAGDPRLDAYRHVGDPDWLRRHGLFVAEGRLVVDRLLALDRYDVRSALVNRAAHDALLPTLSTVRADVYVCEDVTLMEITGFNFHRGCLALAAYPDPVPAEDLITGSTLLALEGVVNPDNVGGLFRTAAAFGVDAVLLNQASGDPFYRKAIRTSMGAALRVPFARVADWLDGLRTFRARGFALVALTPDPSAMALATFAPQAPPKMILLVGAEGAGLDGRTLADADVRVRIPIAPSVDSLNVVVAAGVALSWLRSVRA